MMVHEFKFLSSGPGKEEAQQSYLLAYRIDRRNEDAAHGVIESCAVTVKTCQQLRKQLRKHRDATWLLLGNFSKSP